MDQLVLNSIETVPELKAKVAFTTDSQEVFEDERDIVPITLENDLQYIPWGGDNQLPYHILDLIEKDETLSTCQIFNAEVCYGNGIRYNAEGSSALVREQIDDFTLDNPLQSYFLGVCQDFKHFGWCVTVVILSKDQSKIVSVRRKEVCYCRFSPADKYGRIEKILYANWRTSVSAKDVEVIDLLDIQSPWKDLAVRTGRIASPDDGLKKRRTKQTKFAIVTTVPTPKHTYYPIPYYAALFKGKWYNIKQLIGIAKESKLKNSAPIKYQIEISNKYWESIFKMEGITDRIKQKARIKQEKENIIKFLTGVENTGKVWFSTFYMNPNQKEEHDVVINKIDSAKEGGDWESDIQEAVNMFCFTMRVHSNLVGSVPGKAQTNNSGSDKRELYTIAQALQKPYRDLLFIPHRIIIKYNGWKNAFPECPFIQLTTLDENKDAKEVTVERRPKKAEEE